MSFTSLYFHLYVRMYIIIVYTVPITVVGTTTDRMIVTTHDTTYPGEYVAYTQTRY